MQKPVYITDLFETIVQRTAYKIGNVGYLYGHPVEINETLVQLSKIPDESAKRFPLVALLTDIQEDMGKSFGVYADVNLHILIATLSRKEWKSNERMSLNFKPVLYPVYQELINQVAKSKFFTESSTDRITHTKTDRLFWGKSGIYGNNGLIFTDILDVIELRNLKLTIKSKIC